MSRIQTLLSLLKHVPTVMQVVTSFRGGEKEGAAEQRFEAFSKRTNARLTGVEEDLARLRVQMNRLKDTVDMYRYVAFAAVAVAAIALFTAILALSR
jgi:hypothetical protein